jgi:hypothetical protein
MKRVLIGGVVGGLVVFIWGAVSHMATPLGEMGIKEIPDEAGVLTAIKERIKEPGLYFFPGIDRKKTLTDLEQKAWEEKIKTGPSGIMVVTPSGGEAMSPRQLITELASNILAALVASYLVSQVVGGYLKRVAFVALLGVFGWLSISVSYWNWYGFPTDFSIAALAEEAVGWLLAGLVIAAIAKRASTQSDAPTA